jgi:hypothetical protein
MEAAVQAARRLVRPDGWLAMMTTEDEVERLKGLLVAGMSGWQLQKMPGSERRVFALAQVAEIPAP